MKNLFHKIKLVYHMRNAEVVYVKNIVASSIPSRIIIVVRYVCSKRDTRQLKRSHQRTSAKSTVDDI